MKTISLIIAMQSEADGLMKSFDLKAYAPPIFFQDLPLRFYQCQSAKDYSLNLTVLGRDQRHSVDRIGTESATMAALAAIQIFAPDILVNLGTAGSFKNSGAEIGKVYLSKDRFYFHDHRIPIKGWDEFGRGAFPSMDVSVIANELGLECANVSTGNSLDFTDTDLRLIKESGAILKEMEAAAIASIAEIKGVPFFAIKAVTNLIDENTNSAAEFEKNFSLAVRNLTAKSKNILGLLVRVRQFKSEP